MADGLIQRGIRVFFEKWSVLPGEVIMHRLDAAISEATNAVLVVSPAATASPRALEEYAALATAAAERNLRFIPVLIGEVSLPPFAANRVWRDFRALDGQEYEEKVEELAGVITGEALPGTLSRANRTANENFSAALPSPPRPLTEPDRHSFVMCYSAADGAYGRALVGQLKEAGLPVWSVADLRPGDAQFWQIRRQLAFAAAVVVLMSPSSQESDDITRMILEAMLHQRPFFPVLLEGERNYHLAHTWYVDTRDGRLLTEPEIDLLRALESTGAEDAGTSVLPAPLARPPVRTVRVPQTISIGRIRTYLREGEFTHADLQTTTVLLEAAERLDEGWMGMRHARRIPASVLAAVDAVWSDHSQGRQGFSAQAELTHVRRARHADFLELSVSCGWRSAVDRGVPRSYRDFTDLSGPGPRIGFYPTLRNPQNEPYVDWYDQWNSSVLSVHLTLREKGVLR